MKQLLLLLIPLLLVVGCSDTSDLEARLARLEVENASVKEVTQASTPATTTQTPEATQTQTPEATQTQTPEATQTQTPEATQTQTASLTKPAGQGGRPEDKYACEINSEGYCIFLGIPHETGLKPKTEQIIDRNGGFLFSVSEAVAINSSGEILPARGTPAFNGDELIEYSKVNMTDDEKAFHRVMAIMFPVRNALMYHIAEVSQKTWEELVSELKIRGIKDNTFTSGVTPKDNFYGREDIFQLAKSPNGKDIHHDVMKFLEEAGLYLLCHVTSDDFGQMLQDTHPAGHDPCGDGGITLKVPFD